MIPVLRISFAVAAVFCATPVRLLPQEKASPSLQQQIDELKEGQARILQELQAIHAALRERPPRSDEQSRPAIPSAINVRGEPFKGSTNAVLGIIEYSDFECGHCAQFAAETFPELDRKYIATGKVKYFFRDLPERGNAESMLKARIARCAGEQGKFWQMHDYFFAAHPSLTNETALFREAETAGLETNRLAACLSQDKYSIMIQRSAGGAMRMGIQGTPSFIIGRLTEAGDVLRVESTLLGVRSLDDFQKTIEPLLASAGQTKSRPAE